MLNDILIQIIPQILYFIITVFIGFITTIVKKWWDAHKHLIEIQEQQIAQAIGIDKYNQNIMIAKLLIHSVEEQAKKLNWDSTIKHAKATELISNATGFSGEQIFNIIKATVDELKTDKLKVITEEVQTSITEQAPKTIAPTDLVINEIK